MMATGNRQPVSTRVNEETKEQLERYQDRQEYDDRSDAHREILTIGLQEANGPVSLRWREMALSAAFHLSLLSVVVIVLGVGTSMLGVGQALAVAAVLVTTACAPVAAIECTRVVTGQAAHEFGGDET